MHRNNVKTVLSILVGLVAVAAASSSTTVLADSTVTTYVVKVQEERETTRWTLTEWLKIKERMRMMDLWLAMFSDPKKDKFQPELMLSYGLTRGDYSFASEDATLEEGGLSGS